MGLFCNCVHDNVQHYEQVVKKMHELERKVDKLDWLNDAIRSNSLTLTTREGKWEFKKIETKE